MAETGFWAVVPSKDLRRAKQRLAPVLAPAERSGLARAMLEDVLSALASVHGLAGLLLVTTDGELARLARTFGARLVLETDGRGVTAAVTAGMQTLATEQATGMLIVPADVPLITAAEIDSILAAHGPAPAVTLAPAVVDGGSNALACSPVDAIPFRFGPESFRRHREAARQHGIEPGVVRLPGLARDIDRPEDLGRFVARPSPTRAYAYLEERGIVARLRAMPQDRPFTTSALRDAS
ncbi:2-phospho-L-lactate guanylyltransferase [Rhodospirillaceae bacterium SYSU D60014]|uniref:2-phospho-L-lactate guanylyltransferase n=1 Tax=Virgifigura deserti TaxID=2268457 RepID=UPI000E666F76